MAGIFKLMKAWSRNKRGATAIEYSLIATGIAMAIALVVYSLGTSVNDMFLSISNAFGS